MKKIKRLSILLFVACLLTFASTCREVNSQTVTQIASDSTCLTCDIDLPVDNQHRASQTLRREAYVVSYNKETRQPNWVAWKLTADHTEGDVKRPSSAFHEDDDVPEPRAYHYDYKNSNFDRGHMCPAGDNKWDSDAMYESHLMTNVCPQYKSLNSGIWNQIEQRCRQWARKYGEIYIICGPIFSGEVCDTIGTHRIPVPDAFFKVVVRLDTPKPQGIGYICLNRVDTSKKDLTVCTISDVERITGYTFFPNLGEEIRGIVKDNANSNNW